jgi:hypothetical protein
MSGSSPLSPQRVRVLVSLYHKTATELAQITDYTDTFVGPWVTSVGGTTGFDPEAARFSGGGFSEYFPRPTYQNRAVPAFLQTLGSQYYGLYKCVFYRAFLGPFSLSNRAALGAVAFPISPCRQLDTDLSLKRSPGSWMARAARCR